MDDKDEVDKLSKGKHLMEFHRRGRVRARRRKASGERNGGRERLTSSVLGVSLTKVHSLVMILCRFNFLPAPS